MKKFTIFTIVALLAVALIVPQVMAASKVTPYGRMWFDTFSVDWDKNSGAGNAANANTLGLANGAYNPNFDEQDLLWTDVGYSMIGFNFKAADFTAKVEMNNTVGQRHWYGSYNFGMGSILIGHTWDIGYLSCIPATNADAGQIPWVHKGGVPATQAREAQIRLSFPTSFGHFMFAMQTPQTTAPDTNATAAQIDYLGAALGSTVPNDYETSIPSLRLRWATKPLGPLVFVLFAGYNTFEAVWSPTAATQEMRFDIDSTVLSGQAIASFGPITAKLLLAKSENAENYSVTGANLGVSAVYNWGAFIYRNPTTGAFTLHDSDLKTWMAELTYRATKNISVKIIYGEDDETLDYPGMSFGWETSAWGVIVPITIVPGFQVIPQFQKVDLGTRNINGVDALKDAGEATMVGIQWRFTF